MAAGADVDYIRVEVDNLLQKQGRTDLIELFKQLLDEWETQSGLSQGELERIRQKEIREKVKSFKLPGISQFQENIEKIKKRRDAQRR